MKIYLGIPTNRGIHPEVVRNLVAFDIETQKEKIDLILHFPRSSTVSLSRNLITRKALAENADWILMQDDDIQVKDNGYFQKMAKLAYAENAQIIGLPCRLRMAEEIVLNFADKIGDRYENYHEVPQKSKEIDVIGTGVMLINANWLKSVWPTGPWFSVIDTEVGCFPEDWNFCEKAKTKGAKIMVLPIQTVHWGEMGYIS